MPLSVTMWGVVNEPVDQGGGDHGVAEDLAPGLEAAVAGDDDRAAFVAARDQREEQVRGLALQGEVADEAASHFFQVVSRRYEHGSIVLTTNRHIVDWGHVFNDADRRGGRRSRRWSRRLVGDETA